MCCVCGGGRQSSEVVNSADVALRLSAETVRGLSAVDVVISVHDSRGFAVDRVNVPLPSALASSFATTLSWGTSQVTPGANVSLTVESAPSARVFLLSVDKAVDLLAADAPAAAIDSKSLREALDARQDASMPVEFAPQVCPLDAPVVYAITQQKGMVWDLLEGPEGSPCPTQLASDGGGDFLFGPVFEPVFAVDGGFAVLDGLVEEDGAAPSAPDAAVAARTNFPETWIFEEVTVSDQGDGSTTASETRTFQAPHSITEWRLSAFSTHPALGFSEASGVASPLRVKKDMFVQMTLPPYVVHMEKPTVVLSVQNLLDQDLSGVELTIRLAPGLELHTWPSAEQPWATTDGEDGSTVGTAIVTIGSRSFWRGDLVLKPTQVQLTTGLSIYFSAQTPAPAGLSDAVSRNLIVKPAGMPVEHATTVMIQDPDDGSEQTFSLPAEMAQATAGSTFARLTVVGDVLGSAMANLDRLVKVPTGCGEQNMIGLAPNVYVLSYLDSAGRLGAEMRQTLVKNINVGYQRQLLYRHNSGDDSGGFSAFGVSDAEASTWLTAYVLKVFSEASRYVSIDATVLQEAGAFLIGQQSSSGQFQPRGRVIHEDMMGGAAAPVALTAYVVGALVAADEATGTAAFQAAISKASEWLDSASPSSVYTRLLVLKVWAAASGDWDAAAIAALELRTGTHWKVESGAQPPDTAELWKPYPSTPSLDVEATAYGIQILLRGDRAGPAVEAAQWLVSQQTPRGGWASTQDTVVGLESLAQVAQAMSGSTQITCDAGYEGGGSIQLDPFTVTVDNFDLLQMQDIDSPDPEGVVTVRCSGQGTAVLSLVSWWYTDQVHADSYYKVANSWLPSVVNGRRLQANDDSVAQLMDVTACAALAVGLESGPGQADYHVFELGMLSGFQCDPGSVQAPDNAGVVNRVESDDGKLVVYLDRFPSGGVCLTCQATRSHVVEDLEAVHSRVYSYYNQAVRGEARVLPGSATTSEPTLAPTQAPTPEPTVEGVCPEVCNPDNHNSLNGSTCTAYVSLWKDCGNTYWHRFSGTRCHGCTPCPQACRPIGGTPCFLWMSQWNQCGLTQWHQILGTRCTMCDGAACPDVCKPENHISETGEYCTKLVSPWQTCGDTVWHKHQGVNCSECEG